MLNPVILYQHIYMMEKSPFLYTAPVAQLIANGQRTTLMSPRNYSNMLINHSIIQFVLVKVLEQGKWVLHTGTIYSTKCTSIAHTNGDHPYMCAYCFELTHGKSPLLRKFNRSKKLKILDAMTSVPSREGLYTNFALFLT